MRIISMIAALPMLWATLFPQYALANEVTNTGETKINFNIQNNIATSNEIVLGAQSQEPVKTQEELQREKVLARWKAKQEAKWANLPKGKFVINASAYTAAADECGWNTGITASGLRVKENHTIACPPELPFGAKLKIEGYGVYSCEDRGGAIKGNHIDIYMETKAEAFAFGRRNLEAEIVF